MPVVQPYLGILSIAITNKCNLKCNFCSRNASKENSTFMSPETINSLLKSAKRISPEKFDSISLTGGETLLHPLFWEIVDVCRRYPQADILLTTNGTLITEDIAEKMKERKIRRVGTSIDGPKEIHDRIRGVKGAFEKTIKAIEILESKGIETDVKTTVTKENIKYLAEIMGYLIDIGVTRYSVGRAMPTGRATNIKNSIEIGWEEFYKMLIKCYEISRDNNIRFRYQEPLRCLVDPNILEHVKTKYPDLESAWGGCIAGVCVLDISANGEVRPCPSFPQPISNIYNYNLAISLEKIWNENKILSELRNRDLLKGECGRCKYKYICGGCRSAAMGFTGDYLAPDPLCPFTNLL